MKNFVQRGETVTVTAPIGGINSGAGVLVGALFGVAAFTAAEADDVEIGTMGVFDLPKATGAIAQGAKVYWDDTAKSVTTTATNNSLIGVAVAAAGTSAATVRVRLNGVSV